MGIGMWNMVEAEKCGRKVVDEGKARVHGYMPHGTCKTRTGESWERYRSRETVASKHHIQKQALRIRGIYGEVKGEEG